MNEIAVVERTASWRRLKALVLDSVSSPITKRVYNLGLERFTGNLIVRPKSFEPGGRPKSAFAERLPADHY